MTDEPYEAEMDTDEKHTPRKRSYIAAAFYSLVYFVLLVKDGIVQDVSYMWHNARVFLGSGLVLIGLLNISADRFCDGSTNTHIACTRPTTYYYYSEVAIISIVIGSFLILLWFLRKGSR